MSGHSSRAAESGGARKAPAVLMVAYTHYETDPRVMRAAEAAVEAGFEADVVTLRRRGQARQEVVRGVRVLRVAQDRYRGRSSLGYFWAYGQFILRSALKAAALSVRRRYTIVHVHNMPDVLVLAAAVPRALGAKVILDIHDPMPETFAAKYGQSNGLAYRVLFAFEVVCARLAAKVVTVNEPVGQHLRQTRGYSREKLDVVANFADERLFAPAISTRKPDGYVRFVFHGTILERYGLRTLIAALAELKRPEKVRVRLIGEGDFSAELKALIASRGLDTMIEFRNRAYPLHEIPGLLRDCDVGLVPLEPVGISDLALPLKLVEYSCLGLPAIATRTRCIAHYFSDEECLFYEYGDVAGLAALVETIAEHPERLDGYRARLGHVRERLSWAREKRRYMDLLGSLTESAKDHRRRLAS